eukprot:scaffold112841_cov60-Phaeocystis_antarctica.AAC.3
MVRGRVALVPHDQLACVERALLDGEGECEAEHTLGVAAAPLGSGSGVGAALERDEAGHRVGEEPEELGTGARLGRLGDGELHALDRPDDAAALERQAQHAEVGAAEVERVVVAALRARHPLVHEGGQHADLVQGEARSCEQQTYPGSIGPGFEPYVAYAALLAREARDRLRLEVRGERAHHVEGQLVRHTEHAQRLDVVRVDRALPVDEAVRAVEALRALLAPASYLASARLADGSLADLTNE